MLLPLSTSESPNTKKALLDLGLGLDLDLASAPGKMTPATTKSIITKETKVEGNGNAIEEVENNLSTTMCMWIHHS